MSLRKLVGLLVVGISVVAVAWLSIYVAFGRTAAVTLVRNGGAAFFPIARDSPRLSPSMRHVLAGQIPPVTSGPFVWNQVAPGFAEGDLPVLAEGKEFDRIFLAKIDPALFRVVARNDPTATNKVAGWLKSLHAVLVVNGSYYAPSALPDTPFIADGRQLGPTDYDAKQGALVASDAGVTIRDLSQTRWQDALAGARDAMVSYPLLLDAEGKARPIKPSEWLANRTFVGIDDNGWVVFGTTKDAFFSLARLASFLETSPLKLRSVLNLDGGPISCQAIEIDTFKRNVCGDYEIQAGPDGVKKLTWLYGTWALPIALAVVPR